MRRKNSFLLKYFSFKISKPFSCRKLLLYLIYPESVLAKELIWFCFKSCQALKRVISSNKLWPRYLPPIFFFSLVKVHLISVDTISQDVCSGITNGSNGALGGRARRSNCPHIRDHSGRRALGMRDSRCSAPLTETWSSGKTKLLLSDRRALSTDRAAKGDRSGTAADGSPVEFNTGFIRASRVSAPSSILTNLLRLN